MLKCARAAITVVGLFAGMAAAAAQDLLRSGDPYYSRSSNPYGNPALNDPYLSDSGRERHYTGTQSYESRQMGVYGNGAVGVYGSGAIGAYGDPGRGAYGGVCMGVRC